MTDDDTTPSHEGETPRLTDELALRAGPAPVSPPLAVSLMIFALGIIGPIVFVRAAVPSLALTGASLLLPIAGTIAVIGSVDSMRRRRGDLNLRTRAVIRPDGVSLLPRPEESEHHVWADIASADANRSMLVLHLKGEDGKRTRRAIRYGALETPVELIKSRIALGLQAGGP